MKELKLIPIDKKEIKAEQKQEFKYMGSFRKIPGLKLYEFDYNLMEVKKAYIKKSKYMDLYGGSVETNKVIHNKNAYYYQALNLKSALRKANNIIKEKSGIEKYFKLEKGKVLRKETV